MAETRCYQKFLKYDYYFWWLVCLFCTFVIIGATVLISGFLWLKPEVDGITKTTCYVSGCNCTNSTCSTTSSYYTGYTRYYYTSYYSCHDCKYTYLTIADNTVITNTENTETTNKDYCNDYPDGKEFYCYYHTKDIYIGPSLADSRDYDLPITYISIFGAVACIFLIAFIVLSIYAYIACKHNLRLGESR